MTSPKTLPGAAAAGGAAPGVRAVFQGVLDEEAEVAAEGMDTGDGDGDTWQAVLPETDAADAGALLCELRVIQLSRHARRPDSCAPAASVFQTGRVGFALDAASRLEQLALSSRNALRVEDAFDKGAQPAEGGGRRRTSLFDADTTKRKRAAVILETGADAIAMDEAAPGEPE